MSKKTNPILERYKPMVEGIGMTFGKNCEVVLHDFSLTPNSIIAIANGHVTGRNVGSPMTELSLKKVSHGDTDIDVINYTGKSADGRALKSSTFFIKDDKGIAIGCFCINFDMSELVVARNVLNDMMQVALNIEDKASENVNTVNDVLTDLVQVTIESVGKPVAYLTKDEKVQIVNKLDRQGAFLIKGAIDYVAKVLCVSRYTIYNYLDEIRVEK